MRDYYVYIMTNNSGTLSVGVTNDLIRRVAEHKAGATKGFTSRYKVTRLVYFEVGGDALAAIEREKQIKGWVRRRKIALVAAQNPKWKDLSAFDCPAQPPPPPTVGSAHLSADRRDASGWPAAASA